MTIEIFKDIPGYEGRYQASNKGNIKSLINGKILLGCSSSRYKLVLLYKGDSSHRKTITVHRLVGITFLSNPNNLKQINHIDGNKHNNNIENLEWCDAFHNMRHASKMGKMIGTISTNIEVWNPITKESFNSIMDLSKHLKIKYQTLYSKITGPLKNDTGFEYMNRDTPIRKRIKTTNGWVTKTL